MKKIMDAGIRMYATVCLSSTLFTIIAEHFEEMTSACRIITNIVMGVGFLGAGIIYRNSETNTSHGLTTAATDWGTAAVGVVIGLDSSSLPSPRRGFFTSCCRGIGGGGTNV
jgi:putative Mg2+ transporter-C (MgtC) family protein